MKEIREAIEIMRGDPVDLLKVQNVLEGLRIVNTRHDKVLRDIISNLEFVNSDICVKEAIVNILEMLLEEIDLVGGDRYVV